jgi:hypothetical protein
MWLISLLPDSMMVWLVHLITLAGLAALGISFFLSNIPWIGQYGKILKIAGAIALVLGIYFEGGVATEQKWRDRVTELETKVKEAEEKSAVVNEVVKTKIVNKIKVVKEREIVVQEKIKEVEKLVDAKCEVPKEAIDILNEAAKDPAEAIK